MKKVISRRTFLKGLALTLGAAATSNILTGCQTEEVNENSTPEYYGFDYLNKLNDTINEDKEYLNSRKEYMKYPPDYEILTYYEAFLSQYERCLNKYIEYPELGKNLQHT